MATPPAEIDAGVRESLAAGPQHEWDVFQGRAGAPELRHHTALSRWLAAHLAQVGVRVPTALERARVTGLKDEIFALGLTELQIYNAVGNSFDYDFLCSRMACPLQRLVLGECSSKPRFVTPARVMQVFAELARRVRQLGGRPLDSCLPPRIDEADVLQLRPPMGSVTPATCVPPASATEPPAVPGRGAPGDPMADEVEFDNLATLGLDGLVWRRGLAGAAPAAGAVNVCVADTLSQLLFGCSSALFGDPQAMDLVMSMAERARGAAGIASDGLLTTAAVWEAYLGRFGAQEPTPLLLEFFAAPHTRVDAHRAQLHPHRGTWDGRVVTALSSGAHTIPLWVVGGDGVARGWFTPGAPPRTRRVANACGLPAPVQWLLRADCGVAFLLRATGPTRPMERWCMLQGLCPCIPDEAGAVTPAWLKSAASGVAARLARPPRALPTMQLAMLPLSAEYALWVGPGAGLRDPEPRAVVALSGDTRLLLVWFGQVAACGIVRGEAHAASVAAFVAAAGTGRAAQ